MSRHLRLGLLSPRFEPVTAVGAEVQVRQLARRLAKKGHRVEILTTCVRDTMTWKNHYSPGLWPGEAFHVRRFPADPRRVSRRSVEASFRLGRGGKLGRDDQEALILSLGSSAALAAYLGERAKSYDAFILAPALSGTVFALPREVLGRSLLLAALPSGPAGALDLLGERLGDAPAAVAGSETEAEAIGEHLGIPGGRILRAGAAVEAAPAYDAGAFRRRHGLEVPFLIHVGRRAPGRGVDRLLQYLSALGDSGLDLRLVLLGEGEVDIPEGARHLVMDLHFIDDQDKADGLAAALALCQPSPSEALALATLECWLAGRPVLADAAGAVTVERCRGGGGGLWYRDFLEFEESVRLLLEDGERAARLGRRGRDYVRAAWSWERCLPAFEGALFEIAGGRVAR